MPGNPRDMIVSAERRFPVRIRIGVPPGGFGQRYTEMTSWLDENCGADGWAITPDLDSPTGFGHREWQKCWRLVEPGRKCGAKL